MAVIGYARCSTAEQNLGVQITALKEAGAPRVFADEGVSGSKADRPELAAALNHLREGDVLAVWKLNRLGRNTRHVLEVIDQLHDRGVQFRSLTEGLETTGAMGRVMTRIMAAFAWALMAGLKPVENRSWVTDYRGLLWIHASTIPDRSRPDLMVRATEDGPLVTGALLGHVELVDIVRDSQSH